jgi:hypothetical protein
MVERRDHAVDHRWRGFLQRDGHGLERLLGDLRDDHGHGGLAHHPDDHPERTDELLRRE